MQTRRVNHTGTRMQEESIQNGTCYEGVIDVRAHAGIALTEDRRWGARVRHRLSPVEKRRWMVSGRFGILGEVGSGSFEIM